MYFLGECFWWPLLWFSSLCFIILSALCFAVTVNNAGGGTAAPDALTVMQQEQFLWFSNYSFVLSDIFESCEDHELQVKILNISAPPLLLWCPPSLSLLSWVCELRDYFKQTRTGDDCWDSDRQTKTVLVKILDCLSCWRRSLARKLRLCFTFISRKYWSPYRTAPLLHHLSCIIQESGFWVPSVCVWKWDSSSSFGVRVLINSLGVPYSCPSYVVAVRLVLVH